MLRFGWRIQRFELAAVLLMGVFAALAAGYMILRLAEVAPSTECLLDHIADGRSAAGCRSVTEFFSRANREAGMVLGLLLILPLVIGVIPGSSLLASEIEHRSIQLSWTLVPSRRRWLLKRLLPVVLFVVLASGTAAVAGELLVGGRTPWLDSRLSFEEYGARGPVAVLRTVAFAMIALLVGAVIGRQVPALVIGAVAGLGLLLLLTTLRPFGEPLAPIPVVDSLGGNLVVSARYRADDGTLLTYGEAIERGPPQEDPGGYILDGYEHVTMGVPGERLAAVEFRESIILLAISGAALAATMVVVQRRRPY